MKIFRTFLIMLIVFCIASCGSAQKPSIANEPHVGPHRDKFLLFASVGSPAVGDVFHASTGTWNNSPTSYTYKWQDCDSGGSNCVDIAGATSNAYTVTTTDQGHTIRAVVTATNASGSSSSVSNLSGVVPTGSLPTGVSTQAIDGGSNYYCSNGFTFACNAGWDSPSFIPIADSFPFYPSNSTTSYKSLGMNTVQLVTGGTGGASSCASGATDLSAIRSAGLWAILSADSNCNVGSETVGAHIEEPDSWNNTSDVNSVISNVNELVSIPGISGRFLEGSFTWNQINYDNLNSSSGAKCGTSTTMTMQQVMTCVAGMPSGHHVNMPTDDIYWFAGQNRADYSQFYCGLIYDKGSDCTAAESGDGSHYGDMMDVMRSWLNGNSTAGIPGSAPSAPYVETDDGLVTGGKPIKPGEINWSVWDTFIHGARMIFYFGNTSDDGTGGNGQFGFSSSVQSGQTVSDAAQATSTNTLVKNLAPVINATFANGYVSDNKPGYVFPAPHLVLANGVDAMAKYYSGGSFTNSSGTFGNGFYIFAGIRGAETQTNVSVTFTIKGNYTGSVPYICACSPTQSTGTVSVSGHQFTDTFSKATDVHIYGPIPNS